MQTSHKSQLKCPMHGSRQSTKLASDEQSVQTMGELAAWSIKSSVDTSAGDEADQQGGHEKSTTEPNE